MQEKLMNYLRANSSIFSLAVLQLFFWLGILRYVELPGLYMDAVNPDYLAAHILNPSLKNPVWELPTRWFPILGSLYHGVQNLYVDIPVFWLIGTSVTAIRISQALFGAITVLVVYGIVRRISGDKLFATLAALGLATDIAFIVSFRTQNYIILGGMMWLLLSVYPLIFKDKTAFCRLNLCLSGIFFGLAVYGYFVFLFFLPAFVIEILQAAPKRHKIYACLVWCLGVAIGLFPYLIGYFSLGVALGGPREVLAFLAGMAQGLAPLSSKLSLVESYEYAFSMARLAMTNGGNELMIFGDPIEIGLWPTVKFGAFLTGIALAIFWGGLKFCKLAARWSRGTRLVVYLPCSYYIFSGILGNRLWAHHYSVMTPLFYLLCAVLCYEGYGKLRALELGQKYKLSKRAAFILGGAAIVICNLIQQGSFFQQLAETGGKGKMSSSLNFFAEEALYSASDTVYMFPEWGFFMPFSLLTANTVPYRLEISKSVIEKLRSKYRYIKVAFWDYKDFEKYSQKLESLGVKENSLRKYTGMDSKPAFYVITGQL